MVVFQSPFFALETPITDGIVHNGPLQFAMQALQRIQ